MRVRLYSHVAQMSGYGRAGVELALCLLLVPGVELEIAAPILDGSAVRMIPPEVASCLRNERALHPQPDVVIVHTLPFSLAECRDRAEVVLDATGWAPRWIAYTTWETHEAPAQLVTELVDRWDALWVPSSACRLAFLAGQSGCPGRNIADMTFVVPHSFDASELVERRKRLPADAPDRYRFYYVGAWTQRKNPMGVIRAFVHAFTAGHAVELLVHSVGASVDDILMAAASTGVDRAVMPVIKPRREAISDAAMRDLHARNDCFVTASRGEAWNLPAFDAMLAGNMVIAPLHQGSDEFLDGTGAFRVGYTLAPAMVDVERVASEGDGRSHSVRIKTPQGVNGHTVWRDTDLLGLASAMRTVYSNRPRLVDTGPEDRFSREAVARRIATLL